MFLSGMIAGLTSCLENKGNRSSGRDFAVMVYNSNINALTMNTSGLAFIAPQLQDLKANDCIVANYTIDFDNQPSNQAYYTATEIQYQILSRYTAEKSEDIIDDYTDSIRTIQGLAASPLYKGHIFIITEQAGTSSSSAYDYELICHPDSVDVNEVHTLFLKSKLLKGNTDGNSQSYTSAQAFDLSQLINAYGKDTIFKNSTDYDTEYKCLLFNLKYQSGMKENIPVYTQYGKEPLMVVTFK
jgi:hypothetical protein